MPEYLLVVVLSGVAVVVVSVISHLIEAACLTYIGPRFGPWVAFLPGMLLAQYMYALVMWEMGLLCRMKADKLDWMPN